MDAISSALSLFRGYNLLIREYGNGIAFALCLVLIFVLGSFLLRSYRFAGAFAIWRRSEGANTACVLWWLLIAEGLRAFCAYVPLNAANDGRKLNAFTEDLVSFGFAASIVVLSAILIRSIFLFQAPNKIMATLFIAVATAAVFLWGSELITLIG